MKNKIYFVLLHNLWISQKKLHVLYKDFPDGEDLYKSLGRELLESYWYRQKQIDFILKNKDQFSLDKIKKTLEKYTVDVLYYHETHYPESLKNIHNPPFLIYVQWKLDNSPKFSIVGSRKITSYWQKCIEYIIPGIWNYFEIVSGWALGCDTFAHKISLDKKIKTIVVMGTWFHECYPLSNKDLYKDVVDQGGAVVSIFPFSEPGNKHNFPIRNEIVAGLSVGVLVVEAQEKSGSLITANLAHELWKEVFACPWEIFKQNSGWCNTLIASGEAKMVRNAQDILTEYNVAYNSDISDTNQKKKFEPKDQLEKTIYELLLREPLTIDELFQKIDTDISELSLKLSLLEIGWFIHKAQGGKYELK